MKRRKQAMVALYYIEDDPDIARVVREYLEQKNFKVTVCATIEQAKHALHTRVPACWFYWTGICRTVMETACADGFEIIGRNCRLFFLRSEEMPMILFPDFGMVQTIML